MADFENMRVHVLRDEPDERPGMCASLIWLLQ